MIYILLRKLQFKCIKFVETFQSVSSKSLYELRTNILDQTLL